MSKERIQLIYRGLGAAMLLVLALLVLLLVRPSTRDRLPTETAPPYSHRRPVALEDPQGVSRIENEVLRPMEGLLERLSQSGAPYMSNPQRFMIEATAKQSTEEVVGDIGNYWTSGGLTTHESFGSPCADLSYRLARDVKVKRLVEEGRRDPERVGKLLAKKVAALLPHHKNARWLASLPTEKLRALPGGWKTHSTYNLVLNDPKSDLPTTRLLEIEAAIGNALYVLAAIRYHPGIRPLQEVVSSRRPRPVRSEAFLVYLVDSFLAHWPADQLPDQAASLLAKHRTLIGKTQVSGWHMKASRWNSPWDRLDPMLMVGRVGTEPLNGPSLTLEMEIVPPDLEARLLQGMVQTEVVLDNFLTFCREVRATVDEWHHPSHP